MRGRIPILAVTALAFAGLVAPLRRGAAQAICSAPHSSPVLGSGESLHTLPKGAGWIQVSLLRQTSDRFFDANAARRSFLADGSVRTNAAYLTGALGIARSVDVWAQVPILGVRYSDQSGARTASGFGDPRLSVRVGAELFGSTVPAAIRAGLKLPGREFPVDATLIPLSEGQRDWELSLETGTVLAGAPLYVLGWAGYRWRELNAAVDRKPGDERFAHVALGGRVGPLQAEAAAELMHGVSPRYLGATIPTAARRLVQLQPTISYAVGARAIELTGLFPLSGRNLPAGPAISAGYRVTWSGR